MICWKRCTSRKYRLSSNGTHSTHSELALATRDCVVISNDDGGGEQDTTMTEEKWQQSIPIPRKNMIEDEKQPASSSSSESSVIRKQPITDDEVIVNQGAMMGAGEVEDEIPPPSVVPTVTTGRAQSPIISAFIDDRLEQLRQQYRDLDSVHVFSEEGECASVVSLSSSCSYESKGSEYTLERLKKAGPEFQKFAGLLEMFKVDEEAEGDDVESRLVHTGLTQTQTQTEAGSQSQSQGMGPGGRGGTGFYF